MLHRRVIEHMKARNWTAVALDCYFRLQRNLRVACDMFNEPGLLATFKA